MTGGLKFWKLNFHCSLEEYQWFMKKYESQGKDTDAIEQRMTALEQKLDELIKP